MRLLILIFFLFSPKYYSYSQLNSESNILREKNNKNFSLLFGSGVFLKNNEATKDNGIAVEASYLQFVDKKQGIGFKVHFNYFNSNNILRNSYPKNELIIKYVSPVYSLRFNSNKSYFHIFHSLGILSYNMYFFSVIGNHTISTIYNGNTIGCLFGFGGAFHCKNNLLVPVSISILNATLRNINLNGIYTKNGLIFYF